jgi:hypothetical protein
MHFHHSQSALTSPIDSADLSAELRPSPARRRAQNYSPAALAALLCWMAIATSLIGCAQGFGASKGNPAPEGISVVVNPVATSLVAGEQQQFTAKVTGTTNPSVSWTATGGTISSSGLYTAAGNAGNFLVTATSAADFSKFAQAAITVTPGSAPPRSPDRATER